MSESLAPPSEIIADQMAIVAAAPRIDRTKPLPQQRTDPNRFTDRAKQLVVDNYNEHHNNTRTPPLTIDHVYIVAFTKILDYWKATVGSALVRGLIYEVTYNPIKKVSTVEVFKKINNARIPD
jgi:hypothetical protein